MRILHFLPVYAPAWQFGGPVLSVSRLCEGLAHKGVQVRVITTNAGLPEFPTHKLGVPLSVNGVEVIYYPVDRHRGAIRSRALIHALSEQMSWADLLHVSSIWQPLGLSVQKAAHSAGIPVVHTLRGALGPYSWRRSWWKKAPYFWFRERPLLQKAATLHCTTNQEANEITWLKLKPKTYVLPNPLDLSHFFVAPSLGEKWRKSLNISSSTPVFLIAGRIHHKKGLDLLPHIFSAISDLNWEAVFIGQDDDGSGLALKRALEDLGLDHRCHWIDSLPAKKLVSPYNGADWLLLPSRHENFGNVVAEALACGCGVVVSDKVGMSEMLNDIKNSYILPRSALKWSHLLRRLLTQHHLSGRESPNLRLSQSAVAAECIKLYQSVLRTSISN